MYHYYAHLKFKCIMPAVWYTAKIESEAVSGNETRPNFQILGYLVVGTWWGEREAQGASFSIRVRVHIPTGSTKWILSLSRSEWSMFDPRKIFHFHIGDSSQTGYMNRSNLELGCRL